MDYISSVGMKSENTSERRDGGVSAQTAPSASMTARSGYR